MESEAAQEKAQGMESQPTGTGPGITVTDTKPVASEPIEEDKEGQSQPQQLSKRAEKRVMSKCAVLEYPCNYHLLM